MRIAFLDSGIGGLSVLNAFLEKSYKNSNIKCSELSYFADFKNLPYGNKSKEELLEIIHKNFEYWHDKTDIIILACNTSSSLLTQEIKSKFPNLIIYSLLEGLEANLKQFSNSKENIAVFSTLATHNSESYIKICKQALGEDLNIQSIPCPKLVPFIENNLGNLNSKEGEDLLLEYISLLNKKPDSLIFGCSHYTLMKNSFTKLLPETKLIDPGELLTILLKIDFSEYKFNAITSDNNQKELNAKLIFFNKELL